MFSDFCMWCVNIQSIACYNVTCNEYTHLHMYMYIVCTCNEYTHLHMYIYVHVMHVHMYMYMYDILTFHLVSC